MSETFNRPGSDVPISAGVFSLADLASQSPQFAEIVRLVQKGDKVGAVKIFRQIYKVGLKDAYDAIKDLAAGKSIDLSVLSPVIVAGTDLSSRSEWLAEIEQLVRAGKKIDAIKRYRQVTRVGLVEAKDAIEKLALDNSPTPNVLRSSMAPVASGETIDVSLRGCLFVLFLFGMLLLIALIFFWR